MLACCVLGFGLVINELAGWLTWQGYLLGPLGLGGGTGAWAYSNIGVLVALVVSFAFGVPVAAHAAKHSPHDQAAG